MSAEAAERPVEAPEPDGWYIAHHRATDSLSFGPFATVEEARKWWATVGQKKGVNGMILPLYRNVDWNRKG